MLSNVSVVCALVWPVACFLSVIVLYWVHDRLSHTSIKGPVCACVLTESHTLHPPQLGFPVIASVLSMVIHVQ